MRDKPAILTKEVLNEVQKSGLRTNGIVWGAAVEEFLQRLIESRFEERAIEMLEKAHVYDNMKKKASLCYAMGLISDELYHDIDILRQIRNICAHHMRLEEEDREKIEELESKFINYRKAFSNTDGETIEFRIFFGFSIIMVALIKKINRAEKIKLCDCEIKDLGFEDKDYDVMKQFVDI